MDKSKNMEEVDWDHSNSQQVRASTMKHNLAQACSSWGWATQKKKRFKKKNVIAIFDQQKQD